MHQWHKIKKHLCHSLMILAFLQLNALCGQKTDHDKSKDILQAFPQKLANAVRLEIPKIWDKKTVFDYMDGAAELYMRYGFNLLYTTRYKLPDQISVAEIYDMGNSKDAFGVFSWDLHGEELKLGQGARYENGILRCWQDKFFISIKGEMHSISFKKFAIDLARHITNWVGKTGLLPDLMKTFPKTLKPTNLQYFHHDEDLNTFYYISTENVLELSQSTEGVIADCTFNNSIGKVIVIRYPSKTTRDRAIRKLYEKVFPESSRNTNNNGVFAKLRGKFCGAVKFHGKKGEPLLAVCFEALSLQECIEILQAVVNHYSSIETKNRRN